MNEVASPLVDSEIDLRDFLYMPLDVVRLRDSDIASCASAEEFRCAVLLWCASWHQIPAASLPDNDRILANLAGFGRAVTEWQEHREGALRNWIKCSDGRLYHPVVAEKAREAWEAKQKRRARTEAARQAKLSQKNDAATSQHATDCEQDYVTESVTDIVTSSNGREKEGKGREEIDPGSSFHSDPVLAVPAAKPKRAKPKTQIAEDAQPDEVQRRDAADAGLVETEFRIQWRSFRDHHRAKGSLMADWQAAWRTWLGNIPKFQPARAGPSPPKRNGGGGYGEMLARLKGYLPDDQTTFDIGGAIVDADPVGAGAGPFALPLAIGHSVDQGGSGNGFDEVGAFPDHRPRDRYGR